MGPVSNSTKHETKTPVLTGYENCHDGLAKSYTLNVKRKTKINWVQRNNARLTQLNHSGSWFKKLSGYQMEQFFTKRTANCYVFDSENAVTS